MNSCIYMILNQNNGKFYIGSTKNFVSRKRAHLNELRKNKHHSVILQNAWNKAKGNGFKFIKLIDCKDDLRLKIEQWHLNVLTPCYNVSKSASAPMEGRKHSKETLDKMKGRPALRGPANPNWGTKWSSELREKILSARIGGKRSEETKRKMSETAKRINSISRVDFNNIRKKVVDSLGNVFSSCTEAAKYHKISNQTLCDILKGRHSKTRKGVFFQWVAKDET